ncbi:hypothetical protein [Burkholderia stagnalis]|nr:hypothetical protein [Burkholderia stagnalis]
MITNATRKPWDVSDHYWSSLSDKHKALYTVVRPHVKAAYE